MHQVKYMHRRCFKYLLSEWLFLANESLYSYFRYTMNSVNYLSSFLLPLYLPVSGHFFHNLFPFSELRTSPICEFWQYALPSYRSRQNWQSCVAGVIAQATYLNVWTNLSPNPLLKSRKECMWRVWHFFLLTICWQASYVDQIEFPPLHNLSRVSHP